MKRIAATPVQRLIRRLGFAFGTFVVAATLLSACNILVNDAPLDPEGGIDAADERSSTRPDASRDASNDACGIGSSEDASDAAKVGDAADAGDAADSGRSAVDPCALPAGPADASTDGPRDAAKDG